MKTFRETFALLAMLFFVVLAGRTSAAPIEVQWAAGDFYPTGTGSYSYRANYTLLVDNIAFQKEVGIWAENSLGWSFIPGTYVRSVSTNRELWQVTSGNQVWRFTGRYTVAGKTYWDSNDGHDYALAPTGETKMIGRPNVILGSARIDEANDTLNVIVGVKNLGFGKVVGVHYSTDNWVTSDDAYASYTRAHLPMGHPGQPGAESWQVEIDLDSAPEVAFALFYQVNGQEYWNNNFGSNFTVSR